MALHLSELNPKLSTTMSLRFDCPQCRDHGIRIPISLNGVSGVPNANGCVWQATGTFPDTLTLTPSIDVPGDWHGFIENGEVRNA